MKIIKKLSKKELRHLAIQAEIPLEHRKGLRVLIPGLLFGILVSVVMIYNSLFIGSRQKILPVYIFGLIIKPDYTEEFNL